MDPHGLPCLDLLVATPDILRGLMCELAGEDARWKPAPDRFSVAEVLGQMLHEWALHDLGHIRQMLVRARKYLAGAGRLGDGYRLKP